MLSVTKHQCMNFLLLLFFISIDVSESSTNENRRYPQDALQCYATMATPPKHKVICLEDPRNNYCIKEVTSTTSRRECGASSEYPDDVWDRQSGDSGECVYRKCAASCPNSTNIFEGRDGIVERRAECCTSHFCNSAFRKGTPRWNYLFYWLTTALFVIIL